ncbi:MAG: AMP-binding protein [Saprospiraceae bacterium]|nr:AMP-binding protein [Saprospiraceae bacterium]
MSYQSQYNQSLIEPEVFWAAQAEQIKWYEAPKTILSTDENGLFRWFEGGKMNTCYLALDAHIEAGRGAQTALIYDSPVTQGFLTYSYDELLHETAKVAGALKSLGVQKGDRVIIYMPMIPQVVFAMLACARLGAVHSVVFGGFAAHELALRIDDAKPKVLLTASAGVEFDRIIPYKPIIDVAVMEAEHQIEHLVVYQRWMHKARLNNDRELDWSDWVANAPPAPCTPVDATDPLYILYTSGTTGKPKGIVRDNGGHAVALRYSMQQVYQVSPGDVFWAASDVGWVVGHSYIVYAPLLTGCTTILYEGKPIKTPNAGAFWRVIAEYGVKVLFTAPTGFRAIRKEDPECLLKLQYDISCLERLFLAGERCDAATLHWAQNLLQIPVIDHWWQTESGWPMLATPIENGQVFPIKPGSAGKPVPGFQIDILDADAQPLNPGEEGAVGVKLPLPPGCLPNLWNATDRFIDGYLSAYPGYYFTGDGGYQDEEGYTYITGRIDDVINVAGHRLSTADMEEIVAAHPAVAECAVVGIDNELRGQVPLGFVVLKTGTQIEEPILEMELVQMVRDRLGALACFKQAIVVKRLPKTRSGKILRRIMRLIADKKPYQAPSTIEDWSTLEEIEEACRERLTLTI